MVFRGDSAEPHVEPPYMAAWGRTDGVFSLTDYADYTDWLTRENL